MVFQSRLVSYRSFSIFAFLAAVIIAHEWIIILLCKTSHLELYSARLRFKNVVEGSTTSWGSTSIPQKGQRQSLELSKKDGADNNRSNVGVDEEGISIHKSAKDDPERYSRQVYALGAKAHGFIRQSCIFVEGPVESGLLWECLKNLALSGVGSIIILEDDDVLTGDEAATFSERHYHNANLDDLGCAYINAAKAERKKHHYEEEGEEGNLVSLLKDFVTRLNPSVQVLSIPKSSFQISNHDLSTISGPRPVLLCVDRSISRQIELSKCCRTILADFSSSTIPFVSVESAGVFGKIFCDFGDDFLLVDPDGEAPKQTLLDRIESSSSSKDDSIDSEDTSNEYIIHCVSGERHDVSKGDTIEFQFSNGEFESHRQHLSRELGSALVHKNDSIAQSKMEVIKVHSPIKITAKFINHTSGSQAKGSLDAPGNRLSLINKFSNSFSRVKQPQKIKFLELKQALDVFHKGLDMDSLFAPSDLDKSFDTERRNTIMNSFLALDKYVKGQRKLPLRTTEEKEGDLNLFQSLVEEEEFSFNENVKDTNKGRKHIQNFYNTCGGKLTPIQAFLGGIASQEVLKASSGVYQPIHQFLLYDADEILDIASLYTNENDNNPASPDSDMAETTMSGQSYILGSKLSDKLQSTNIFVVGAGAIGCEILKNLAAMTTFPAVAHSTVKSGKITVTDMDTIEKSNLSRQLLFRDNDVGKYKSMAAEEAVLRFNPNMKVEAHVSKVGAEDESDPSNPFTEEFWSKRINIVMNALDNVQARLYMDSKCVEHGLSMVDAGTLGSKGNVQVVVPYLSESYASSADPVEEQIPVCTLKNFPYEISHTIQWARDMFDGMFTQRATRVMNLVKPFLAEHADNKIIIKSILSNVDESDLGATKDIVEDLKMYCYLIELCKAGDGGKECRYNNILQRLSLDWAINLFEDSFRVKIRELLKEHPADSLDEDGHPFWSKARKMPKEIMYHPVVRGETDETNSWIVQFIKLASRLRAEVFLPLLAKNSDEKALVHGDNGSAVLEPSCEDVKTSLEEYFLNSEGSSTTSESKSALEKMKQELKDLLSVIAQFGSDNSINVKNIEFEKDNEALGHVAFVTAASNLRAIAYGIPTASSLETRRVAGKIVPAMITTTSVVSALSCLELIKSVADISKSLSTSDGGRRHRSRIPLHLYRNAFVNLAQPFFAFVPPLPSEPVVKLGDRSYTLWDRINIKESTKSVEKHGGMTLTQLKKRIKKVLNNDDVDVASITLGPFLVYANFLHDYGDDSESIHNSSIWNLMEQALSSTTEEEKDMEAEFDGREGDESTSNMIENPERWLQDIRRKRHVDLTVVVDDETTGEEIELPPVRIIKAV